MTKEFFERGKRIAKWADNNMAKNEALKMAITQFERIDKEYDCTEIIDICKEALEQPAQEPVAMYENGNVNWINTPKDNSPLYTHPAPSWQGLSDDKILEIDKSIDPKISIGKGKTLFARAIEQALKEKNNG